MCNYEGFCACTSLCNYNIKVYSFPLSVSSRDAFNSVWFIKGCFGQMALAFFISTSEVAVNFTKVFWIYLIFIYNNSSFSTFKCYYETPRQFQLVNIFSNITKKDVPFIIVSTFLVPSMALIGKHCLLPTKHGWYFILRQTSLFVFMLRRCHFS